MTTPNPLSPVEALLPCPFCGGPASMMHWKDEAAELPWCRACDIGRDTAAQWNARAVLSVPAMRTDGEVVALVQREFLGKLVRAEWMRWAREQPNPKPSWLQPWEELTEPEREVDRRIGEALWKFSQCNNAMAPSRPLNWRV